jgi:hypothetical protein
LIVTVAVAAIAAAREVTIPIAFTTIEIPIATVATIEIAVARDVADSATIEVARAVKVTSAVEIARAIARIAAGLIKPPRYVSTTRRITIAPE